MKRLFCIFLCFVLILSFSVSAFAANEYTVVNYVEQPKKDGTTLALFHFDGNLEDSSGNGCVLHTNLLPTFETSAFGSAAHFSSSLNNTIKLSLSESLDGDFTIEGIGQFSLSKEYDESIVNALGQHIYLDTYITAEMTEDKAELDARSAVEENLWTEIVTEEKGSGWNSTVQGPFYRSCSGPVFITLGSDKLMASNYYEYEHPSLSVTYRYNASSYKGTVAYHLSEQCTKVYDYSMTLGETIPFSIVRSGDTVTYYEFGKPVCVNHVSRDSSEVILKLDRKSNVILDELRISNKALYTSDYTPSEEDFYMETYFTPPESGTVNQIAVNSAVPVALLTMGDVAPETPAEGDVFVNVRYEHIKEVQQYQNGEWVAVEASIYTDENNWVKAVGYDIGADNAVDYSIYAIGGVFSFLSVFVAFIISQPVLVVLLAACLLPVVIAIFKLILGSAKH